MTSLLQRASLTLALFAVAGCNPADNASTNADELPSGVTLIETVAASTVDEIVIPYKKYQLDNGLTVILHEDNSDPLVHVDVTYHVGSGREDIGKSGFAHLFEHMMFQGSENVGDEQHFKIISESGGTLNGTTNTDRTNYFQTVPSNQLEKILWLEADRMGFLLDAVTQEKFEIQRDTVKNERGQRVDNRPYGRLGERVAQALYPEGHPYSWPVIGYMQDLDRVNVNDLKAFFLRWYGPNNAALTIGGRFDEAQALEWIVRYFGSIPRGPEVTPPVKAPAALDADRYISMEDNVALPLLYFSFPTVHMYHEDEAPLDVLASILGEGETSLFYKNLVKNRLAVQAQASQPCYEIACALTMFAIANPAAVQSLADFETIFRDTLLELEERGVHDDDLARVKMNIVSGMIYRLESVSGKAGRLAFHETFAGNPNYTAKNIAAYEAVTKEDVMRVYKKYIKDKPAVIMSVVPNGQLGRIAHEDTWTPPERSLPEYTAMADSDLEYRRATDDFDRSVMPQAGENPEVTLPAIWRARLDNGITVLGAANKETPTVAIRMEVGAGQQHEPLDKLGLATITAAMLNESTMNSSNEEITNRLRKLGSVVQFDAGDNDATMLVRSLSENFDATLAIAAEMLLTPRFDPADFEKVKAQMLQSIEHNKKEPAVTASDVYSRLLFGEENSFAHPNIGTSETVAGITLDDVKQFYEQYYSPRVANIIVVSNLERKQVTDSLGIFAGWEGPEVADAELQPFPELHGNHLYLVDKPGAAQSEIRIGKRSIPFDATGEYYRAGIMNFVLGGAFNSRINLNLREDKGYTYGARSGFAGNHDYGRFIASAAVRSDATADSIVQFDQEIRGYAENGITEEELVFTRRSLGQRDARSYETPWQKLGFLAQILEFDLEDDFVDEQKAILSGIGRPEINQLAKRHLSVDDMIIVVVGDATAVRPGLEKLGYEIVDVE
ncbi:MAG: insulinase family protein [Woeseiaceae bacterium]|nr:insulinase family protein [Woeseiaceae bacterium]